jgi:hypothetical protein
LLTLDLKKKKKSDFLASSFFFFGGVGGCIFFSWALGLSFGIEEFQHHVGSLNWFSLFFICCFSLNCSPFVDFSLVDQDSQECYSFDQIFAFIFLIVWLYSNTFFIFYLQRKGSISLIEYSFATRLVAEKPIEMEFKHGY